MKLAFAAALFASLASRAAAAEGEKAFEWAGTLML